MSNNAFFASKRKAPAAKADRVARGLLTEDQLGWLIMDACAQLGWKCYWLRKTINSSEGILDMLIVPLNPYKRNQQDVPTEFADRYPILHRELKGHDARGRLGKPTDAQLETIALINQANGDAALWEPADWFSGKILEELR